MNHNFKPGDLAILLTDVGPLVSGAVVTLVCLVPAGYRFEALISNVSKGEAVLDRPMWRLDHQDIPQGEGAMAPESKLMPLRGDRRQEQQQPQSKYELLDDLEADFEMRGIPV
ncbi:hypothetical protein [Pseudomonas oryzihabitans]|uniref:hypothetical protein n=1 Tax=Pseudomonas oryzihabitans TaxID=47885 RepID=UPI0011231489|nr:hypothetical protein [Pseudomonas psychrotolerans]QDD91913.1 hypothetical protein CCZ28_24030 [Pseudomonas psychrotolerans]